MQEYEQIRLFMKRRRLDQVSLAGKAGVSQSTVSRAISGTPLRRGRAYLRLIAYIDRETATAAPKPLIAGKKRVTKAFEKIWDGSEVHATAVAKIIEDLADLLPSRELRRRLGKRA